MDTPEASAFTTSWVNGGVNKARGALNPSMFILLRILYEFLSATVCPNKPLIYRFGEYQNKTPLPMVRQFAWFLPSSKRWGGVCFSLVLVESMVFSCKTCKFD